MSMGLRGLWVSLSILGVTGLVAACADRHDLNDGSGGSAGSGATGNAAGDGSEAGNGSGSGEACSAGDAEPCYESADGTAYEGEPPQNQMTCRYGERKCESDGKWGVCLGAVAPEAADTCEEPGNDANCNGVPNEGCPCDNGTTRPCGIDEGNCQQGEQTCVDEKWGTCEGEIKPTAIDSCDDGDDADCNGVVNEGCSCLNGESKPCGTDTGPCEFGAVTCVNGVYPETCTGGVQPAAKDGCEPGNDANCNGTANELCACTGTAEEECGIDTGACTKGTRACEGGVLGMCMGGVVATANDTCHAADEANDTNCNGQFRDGCACVATDPPIACGDAGCGSKACDGDTGQYGSCTGDNETLRCNPNAPDNRQVCGPNGAWVANACPANTVCRDDGDSCKAVDGQPCTGTADCATGTCSSFYLDDDDDNYRANSTVAKFCGSNKDGYVPIAQSLGDDCDDGATDVNPGATELCDGADNDCDNLIDLADTGAGLTLSGTAKVIEGGTDSAVASNGSVHGIVFAASGKTYFTTLNQGNTIALTRKEIHSVQTSGIAITWNGTSFGAFYRLYGGQVFFRRATAAGAFSPATAVVVGDEGIGNIDPSAAYMTGQGYFYAGWGNYLSGQWVYGYGLSSADIPSTYIDVDNVARYSNVAASGDRFGLVWNDGIYEGTGSQVLQVSIRNASNAQVASTTLGAATLVKKAAIAARTGGGFAVIWNESTTIKYQEISATGATLCGPISRSFSEFLPDQMVPTKRGFLAVSGYNHTVKLQEVLAGCTWGSNFPNIGTGTETNRAHISGGTGGFAVVWDRKHGTVVDEYIYARTFGPNLCD
jgi:hypothetical protein